MPPKDIPTAPRLIANRKLAALPPRSYGQVALYGSRWPRVLLGTLGIVLGLVLSVEISVSSSGAEAEKLMIVLPLSLLLLVGGFRLLSHKPRVVLVCALDGLYFPCRRGTNDADSWLLVPWRNVITYGGQRLLDETSAYGLVVSLRLTTEEEHRYLAPYRLLGGGNERPDGGRGFHNRRFGIGNLARSPGDIVATFRQFENSRFDHTDPCTPVSVAQ